MPKREARRPKTQDLLSMLTTLREVLTPARAQHYAVPAFDCSEDIMVRAILESSDALRAPVILMTLLPELQGAGMVYMSRLIRGVAEYHQIPVVLHLDHAENLDLVKAALDHGFTSVMVDGSKLPLKENIAFTQAAVDLARPYGASVEGELGHVGGMDLERTASSESVLTDPDEVARFVDETEVDALAVSIGTAHGIYRSRPTLSISRLKQLHAASRVPLVLHGGSGTPEEQVQEAICNGICKVNVYADCRVAMARGLQQSAAALRREDPLPTEMFGPIKDHLCRAVAEKIRLFFAEGRVFAGK
jgi:fructose-bisphosphate aldolase, class II